MPILLAPFGVASSPTPPPSPPAPAFDPFAGPAISHLVPLTESQAEIWTACQFGGDDASRAYNESVGLRLRGSLDRPALERAWRTILDRHEALRLAFSADGRYGYVVQSLNLPLDYQDIQAAINPERVVAGYVAQEAHHLFDLLHGPLVRAGLLQLGPTEHHFVLTAHHIVCDGWSMGILLQELSKLYSAFRQHRPPTLPPPGSFRQYADELAAGSRQPAYQRVAQYWLGQFAGDVPVVSLPTDFPRPARRTYQSARADYPLAPELTTALKRVGLRAGCTFVTTLLVAFEAFMYQLTGQADLVVGLPAAGQSAAAMPQLVGHCVNLLPLRSHLRPELSFADYLRQRKPSILDAYEHQQFTFGSLLKKLRLARDAARVPLVPVVFNLDLGLDNGVAFEGLSYQLASNPRAYEAFELFVNASGSEQALTLEWSYNTALFRPETIARLMGEFSALLQRLTDAPGTTLRELTSAPAVALAPAYQALNATTRPYPATKNLAQLLAEQAVASPHATAVEFGAAQLTYQALHEQANRLAHYLRGQGVGAGAIVALAVERGPDLLVALLACLKCGAPYLPLDPSFPAERLEFMLADSEARLVLASAPLPLATTAPVLLLEAAQLAAADLPAEAPAMHLDSTSPLYVLYTSGSTGKPKGVVVSHRNVVNFLHSMQHRPGLTASDRLLAVTTISFDIAGLELFLPLLSGATVVLAPAAAVPDGRQLLQLLHSERISVLQATPTSWRMLLDAGWETPLPLKALSGGEALPLDLAERLLARCQSVWNLYGPTETTIWSAVKQVQPGAKVVTIGRPIANTQFYVLDEYQRPVAPGEAGELCIAGDGVAHGYLHRPALTAERFIRNPFAAQGGLLYRTGDLGELLPSGELLCRGRLDFQLKLRGHRIEPGEIEHALLTLPDVREAVISTQEVQPGDERLVAHLVLADDAPANSHRVRAARWRTTLLRQLPAYMVPTEFVCLTQLPRTLNGKTDRAALAQPAAPLPLAAATYVEPRTDHERLVADIWQECLASPDPIGATDDFFASGGHSLIAVQVMLRLEQATGKRLPLSAFFEQPTVAKLATLLDADSQPQAWNVLVPIKPAGTKNPLYIVHGIGLNVLVFNSLPKHMDADQPVYGLQAQGLNNEESPLRTIEDIAANYVAAVVAHNPAGPYSLAGYSYGGTIAYEMARQLLAAGRQVRFLGMLDTYAYQSGSSKHGLVNAWKEWVFTAKNLAYKAWLFSQNPRLVVSIYNPARFRHLLEAMRYSKPEREQRFEQAHGHSLAVGQLYEMAQRNYRLTPQPLRVHLFRNVEQAYYLEDFTYLGWQPLALAGVKVHDIPGNHFSIFDSPNDRACAQAMQQALDACP